MSQPGFLVLESGEIFQGIWRGGLEHAGEVVFNTSHGGYEEIATDPSYFRQIMVMTAPMQGNYGADRQVWESRQIWIEGFVCLELQNSARDSSWMKALAQSGVPILTDLDTRALVLRLRDQGTPWGALVQADNESVAKKKAQDLIRQSKDIDSDWVYLVSRKKVEDLPGKNSKGPKVAVLDFGCKENTLRELVKRCREVRIFPSRVTPDEVKAWQPDGIMLSNGPGDPQEVQKAVETVQALLGWRFIFGICMGHQLLALALGAKTYKLKFGHRGGNHPIKDDLLNRIYMTSQNHGYAVDRQSLPSGVRVTHTNLNDNTVSGIAAPDKRCFGVQFHPESHPGPHDAVNLFDYFVSQTL
ncbi:MAG: glutamine-hydrolyzing carbamoyl-phosphate synthase small subunit [Bdellovibrionales bacterium]